MGGFSIWHWLVLVVVWVAFGWPFWRIVKRTGHTPLLSLLLFVPLLNIAVLWFLAFAAWPRDRD